MAKNTYFSQTYTKVFFGQLVIADFRMPVLNLIFKWHNK